MTGCAVSTPSWSVVLQWFITVHVYGHQVFEADGGKPELVLAILESGHMLVSQGHELLVRPI